MNEIIVETSKKNAILNCVKLNIPIMLIGMAGTGKTEILRQVSSELSKNLYFISFSAAINGGRDVVIGTRELVHGETIFRPSLFLQAISDSNALVVLDEINRADYEAMNLLMNLLDGSQELYVSELGKPVKVADGVAWAATANIGYAATKKLDEALVTRFTQVQMNPLSADSEKDLLVNRTGCSEENARRISSFASKMREQRLIEKIDDFTSTRESLVYAKLSNVMDLQDVFEETIITKYNESDRVVARQVWDLFSKTSDTSSDGLVDDLFSDEDMAGVNP